jgi:hypothetical protein
VVNSQKVINPQPEAKRRRYRDPKNPPVVHGEGIEDIYIL